jgi:hypothetical protein
LSSFLSKITRKPKSWALFIKKHNKVQKLSSFSSKITRMSKSWALLHQISQESPKVELFYIKNHKKVQKLSSFSSKITKKSKSWALFHQKSQESPKVELFLIKNHKKVHNHPSLTITKISIPFYKKTSPQFHFPQPISIPPKSKNTFYHFQLKFTKKKYSQKFALLIKSKNIRIHKSQQSFQNYDWASTKIFHISIEYFEFFHQGNWECLLLLILSREF